MYMYSLMKHPKANTCETVTLANEIEHFWYREALWGPSQQLLPPSFPSLATIVPSYSAPFFNLKNNIVKIQTIPKLKMND